MSHSCRIPRAQRGATLIVALIMLVALAMLSLWSFNAGTMNLRVVGNNCTDAGGDCESGEDAVEIGNSSRVWIDHVGTSSRLAPRST